MTFTLYPNPPVDADETTMALAVLERTRSVFAWKCGGVDAAGMRATVGVSKITLGGLVKHMASVEDDVFTWRMSGGRPQAWWLDHREEPDWVWTSAAEDSPEALFALWHQEVERSRANVAEALTRGDLGQSVDMGDDDGKANLRRLVLDMIDEYARHNGHADLIRETIDGVVGEDPPEGFTG